MCIKNIGLERYTLFTDLFISFWLMLNTSNILHLLKYYVSTDVFNCLLLNITTKKTTNFVTENSVELVIVLRPISLNIG